MQGHPRQTGHGGEFCKVWSTGEGNGKPIQHSCLENPMKSMKKQKEYQSGLLFPPPGDLPDPGIEPANPAAPALGAHSLPLNPLESPKIQMGMATTVTDSQSSVLEEGSWRAKAAKQWNSVAGRCAWPSGVRGSQHSSNRAVGKGVCAFWLRPRRRAPAQSCRGRSN